jgi:predicted 2-oxoglutarate/Fe(II)-dependent dioxygenase YbiX
MEVMASSAARRRHLPSSPFQPDPEPVVEQFEVGDLVSHDSFGMGRVTGVEADAVTVDFRSQTRRVVSPFARMSKL